MESFEHLRRTRTVLLTTRRRDGRTVDTPVNLAVDDDGNGYFRSWPAAGKVKRLANFPGLRIAPCTMRGRPTGSDQPAIACRLTGPDAAHAEQQLTARYPVLHGRLIPLVNRLSHREWVFYRVVPADEPTPWHG